MLFSQIPKISDHCITVSWRTVRYPFVYYNALFFNTFFQNVWSVSILCLCCTISMMHFFRGALFSCSSFFVFHCFHCALSLCCTFSCCAFSWCTLSMLQFFHIGLFWYFAISFAFHVFFVLHLFHVALFSCCCFSVFLYSHAAYLRWLFSCCAVSILHSFYVQCPAWIIRKPQSDCIFFMCCVKCVIK